MTVRKARLIVAAAAGIAVLGGAWWGYDQLRGRFMDIEEAEAAFHAGNYRTAFRAAERLAPEREVIAQTILGVAYWKGWGTDRDFPLAAEWLTRAAEQGYARAMTNLADLHFYDYLSLKEGRFKDRPLAAEWYRRAAKAGDSYAQLRLGLTLVRGQGVDTDRDAGVAWMMGSIEAGDRWVMFRLGYMYESGELGEQDFHKALDLYRRAARLGDMESARLAIELLRDEKSPVFNLEEAYFWALIANQWWPDDPTNGRYFVSVAETVHRVHPPADPQDYARATLGLVDEETDPELRRAHRESVGNPQNWPFRLEKAARRRSEDAASAIIARWPEAPARGESVEE